MSEKSGLGLRQNEMYGRNTAAHAGYVKVMMKAEKADFRFSFLEEQREELLYIQKIEKTRITSINLEE